MSELNSGTPPASKSRLPWRDFDVLKHVVPLFWGAVGFFIAYLLFFKLVGEGQLKSLSETTSKHIAASGEAAGKAIAKADQAAIDAEKRIRDGIEARTSDLERRIAEATRKVGDLDKILTELGTPRRLESAERILQLVNADERTGNTGVLAGLETRLSTVEEFAARSLGGYIRVEPSQMTQVHSDRGLPTEYRYAPVKINFDPPFKTPPLVIAGLALTRSSCQRVEVKVGTVTKDSAIINVFSQKPVEGAYVDAFYVVLPGPDAVELVDKDKSGNSNPSRALRDGTAQRAIRNP